MNRIITFGCRLNAAESEAIQRAAAVAGLEDAVIVNTCAVTAEAERQARQAIRRARREHPRAPIIVTGCAAELAPERYAALPEVDRVLGNRAKLRPDSYRLEKSPAPAPAAAAAMAGAPPAAAGEFRALTPAVASEAVREENFAGAGGRGRAFLEVQHGCDHRCTFCVIPFARGPSRSVPIEIVVAEARRLCATGCPEIVLTGVDLTAYGGDLPGRPRLGSMARQLLAAVPELKRLRLSSLDPAEIDPELWRLLAEEKRLMPHLHLSLQSGDDLLLKRMRRRHSPAEAIAVARQARRLRPEIALGADLIAGFPTESEEMFRHTLDLVDASRLSFLHVFPFSPRAGTPAARMPQLAPAIIKERAARLRAAGAAALAADLSARVGSVDEVMAESPGSGRAASYARVDFTAPLTPGAIRRMRFIASTGTRLVGVPEA